MSQLKFYITCHANRQVWAWPWKMFIDVTFVYERNSLIAVCQIKSNPVNQNCKVKYELLHYKASVK